MFAKPTVAFPDVKRFDQLFTGAGPWAGPSKPAPRLMRFRGWAGKGWSEVSGYVHDRDGNSLSVTGVSLELRNYLETTILHVPNDSIYFELIRRDDGTALVTAQYNVIIGSRWLAVIDAATIPAFDKPAGAL